MTTTEESIFFRSAIILTHGLYIGQASYLNIEQVVSVTSVYNFFSDYEIPFKDGIIDFQLFLRAAQDGYLPHIYNAFVVHKLFEEVDEMDFYALAICIKALRMYVAKYEDIPEDQAQISIDGIRDVTMNKVKFKKAIESLPVVSANLIENSYVPKQQDVELANKSLKGKFQTRENQFLKNYNNLIFLQKSSKKSRKTTKSPTIEILEAINELDYAQGSDIFFNMMSKALNRYINQRVYRLCLLVAFHAVDPFLH